MRQARSVSSGVPVNAGSTQTSADATEPSTKYCGSGGKFSRFVNLPASRLVGEYAKISRPVPRSKVWLKLTVSRFQTPPSKACRKPSLAPANSTLRRFDWRFAKSR